jgi:glycerol uptake facilitator-like aquaporin
MHTHSWPRKLLVEFGGTFLVALVAVAVGGRQGTFFAGAAYGFSYGAAIAALGHISGGHFNPAVTVAHWVTHRLGTFAVLLYIAVQLAGATAAAYTLRLAPPAIPAGAAMLGPPVLAAGVTRGPALLIEATATAALVLALWATIVGRARPRYWLGGMVAGVVVAAASYLGAPYTGGVLNPARAFGPALVAQQWAYQGVYWVGPLAGAVAAASLYDLLFRRSSRATQEVSPKAGD